VAVKDKVPKELHNRLGIAVAQRTYRAYRELLLSVRWRTLAAAGAQPQRLLWASTGTKDPVAPDTLYLEALAAPDTVNTIPEKTLLAFADHGRVSSTMAADGADSDRTLASFSKAGVDVEALSAQLQHEGAESFSTSWKDLMAVIADRTRPA
jgi:transaldolase